MDDYIIKQTRIMNTLCVLFVVMTLIFFIPGMLMLHFADQRSDKDRENIKAEQEISRHERAENRQHILRLEAEIMSLKRQLIR